MGYVIRGMFTNLTPAEKLFLITHPTLVMTIHDLAEQALAEARRRFPGPGLYNGRGDAFRHCFWSALMTREIGADDTRAYTTAHEDYSDNPPGERAMDLHNNGVGIAIGQSFGSATDTGLSNQCAAALTNGRLVVSPRMPGKPYEY